jgi:ABC-2 type transport system ATP-binding protein
MINCSGISKRVSESVLLEDVSFSAEKGELVGILGPNGAGKTTTMRILSTYITPSSGTAMLGGYDIYKEPEKVREIIGILPESPPLYDELSVKAYIEFIARLRKVHLKEIASTVTEVIERCRLTGVFKKSCGSLSKGFRQKVGLAAAMVGDPRVLLLDEPTSGLDPKEITEIRSLIKELKKDRTILFSSHILSEVSELCDKLVFFVRGKTVLEGSLEELTKEESLESVFLHALREK